MVAVLHSRLLPLWALEDHFFDPETNRSVMYYELCPLTPMLFFNHYWDSRPDRSSGRAQAGVHHAEH